MQAGLDRLRDRAGALDARRQFDYIAHTEAWRRFYLEREWPCDQQRARTWPALFGPAAHDQRAQLGRLARQLEGEGQHAARAGSQRGVPVTLGAGIGSVAIGAVVAASQRLGCARDRALWRSVRAGDADDYVGGHAHAAALVVVTVSVAVRLAHMHCDRIHADHRSARSSRTGRVAVAI